MSNTTSPASEKEKGTPGWIGRWKQEEDPMCHLACSPERTQDTSPNPYMLFAGLESREMR